VVKRIARNRDDYEPIPGQISMFET
jgi:hypothetical protein